MLSRTRRWMLTAGGVATGAVAVPIATPAQAQRWDDNRACQNLSGRDRARCERDRGNRGNGWDRDRDRRERARRSDAKTDGIVAGVVGTAILAGVIAAVADGNKKKNRGNDRRDYCMNRYGNYDERSDSYRASDGRWYRCQ